MTISKEEFSEWKNDKVTMAIFQVLDTLRTGYMMQLANGATLGDKTAEETAKVVGRIQGINDLMLVDYEEDINV